MGGKECEHIVADIDAFAESTGFQHFETCRVVRTAQLDGQPPFETGKQTLFEILQVHRSAVGSENQLFPALVKVVEDIEEGILGALSHQILDVIHNQDVHPHVIGHEVHQPVAFTGFHILGLELVPRHVQDNEFREFLLDLDAGCLGDVRLAEAGTAENEKRIEGRLARGHGDAAAGGDSHLVALPFNQVGKAISRVQTRVDLHFLNARIHKRRRST